MHLLFISRLEFYGLKDANDDMPNFLILSLQTDHMIPVIKQEEEMKKMEIKLQETMNRFNLTRFELFQNIAVRCENFIGFVREKSFGPDFSLWPQICGDIFYDIPIFTPFGTCFTTKMTFRCVIRIDISILINLSSEPIQQE